MPYVKMTPSGRVDKEYSLKNADLLKTMQYAVDGYIETISSRFLAPEVTQIVPTAILVVDEEGRIFDRPYNANATACVDINIRIAGPALLLKTALDTYGETDIVELTDDEADRLIFAINELTGKETVKWLKFHPLR